MYAYASYLPKKIIMLDGDVVSISNLNRQIFFDLSDVNRLKCDVLFFPNIIQIYPWIYYDYPKIQKFLQVA